MEVARKTGTGERGIYSWFEEHGADLVHPADLEAWRALRPSGKVFRREGPGGEYIVLRYGEANFRVRPELFEPIDAPVVAMGRSVALKTGEDAAVLNIGYHHKRNEPMYQLTVAGRKKSKRYWNGDFDDAANQLRQREHDALDR